MTEDEFVSVSNYEHLGVAIHSLRYVLLCNDEIGKIIKRLDAIKTDIYINKIDGLVVTKRPNIKQSGKSET